MGSCESAALCTPTQEHPTLLTHREERDQRRNDIEHLATSLVGKVNECVAALDEGVWKGRYGVSFLFLCPCFRLKVSQPEIRLFAGSQVVGHSLVLCQGDA